MSEINQEIQDAIAVVQQIRNAISCAVVGQSEAVNVGYTHLDRETKRGAVAKLPNILKH